MKVDKILKDYSLAINEFIAELNNRNMNKINVEVKTKKQRDELIKQLEGMTFERVLPKTWEEYLETLHPIGKTINEKKVEKLELLDLPKLASQYKLERLIDCYNDGWTPDYKDSKNKHVICCKFNDLRYFSVTNEYYFFTFKTRQLRDKFLGNFEEMIKKHYNIE